MAIISPSEILPVKGQSSAMGYLFSPQHDWNIPGRNIPDGSFALFRSDGDTVELATDIVGSRTIWYIQTPDIFLAATSQRAIVYFLESFEPNEDAFLWMLSSGSLGPGSSWDRRIKCLPPDSRLLLNRQSWDLTVDKRTALFAAENDSRKGHQAKLENDIREVSDSICLDVDKWVLPLSGGYDSRLLLLMLRDTHPELKCITWGLKESLQNGSNDAHIATKLCELLRVPHEFFVTDISDEPVEKIFTRFLTAGEGRIDHIAGYMDGFSIWKSLFERRYAGIIRGDEGFGWSPVSTPLDVRRHIGVSLLSDYSNLKSLGGSGFLNFDNQHVPENLERRDQESLATWRDRLYHEYRIPVLLAALNDLKSSYVEIFSPFLSRRIIERVRKMPDHLRTDKRLYKEIVESMSPDIDFAKYPALEEHQDILKTRGVAGLIADELDTTYSRDLLSDNLIGCILSKMTIVDTVSKDSTLKKLRRIIKYSIPTTLQNTLRNTIVKKQIDFNVLAFRVYIICKMNKMLSSDAQTLRQYRLKEKKGGQALDSKRACA